MIDFILSRSYILPRNTHCEARGEIITTTLPEFVFVVDSNVVSLLKVSNNGGVRAIKVDIQAYENSSPIKRASVYPLANALADYIREQYLPLLFTMQKGTIISFQSGDSQVLSKEVNIGLQVMSLGHTLTFHTINGEVASIRSADRQSILNATEEQIDRFIIMMIIRGLVRPIT